MSPGFLVTRTMMYRHRLGIGVALAVLAVSVLSVMETNLDTAPPALPASLVCASGLAFFYLITVFIHQETDVMSAKSSYPRYYFILPVKTVQLVLWPMSAGVVGLGGTAYLLGLAVHSAFAGYPPLIPAFMVATTVAVLQAVFWFPYAVPYVKLVLTLLLLVVVPLVWPVGLYYGWGQTGVLWAYAALSLAAFGQAVLGLELARRGGIAERGLLKRPSRRTAPNKSPGFRSSLSAQAWYEWRQQGRVLPIVTALILALAMVPLLWEDTLTPPPPFLHAINGVRPTIPTYLDVFIWPILYVMPILGWVVGCGARRLDLPQNDRRFNVFFATRPLSDSSLAAAKFKTVLFSVGLSWILVLATLAGLLLFAKGGHSRFSEAFYGEPFGERQPLYQVLAPYMGPDILLQASLLLAVSIFFTARNYALGLWLDLTGFRQVRYVYLLVVLVAFALFDVASSRYPTSAALLTWTVYGLVTTKAIAAACIIVAGLRRGALRTRTVLLTVLAFASLCSIALACWHLLWPSEFMRQIPTAGLVLLYVPFARILLAPVALSWTRHQ